MQGLAHLDADWGSVEEYSDFRLLPEGNRIFEITGAKYEHNTNLDKPMLVIDLWSADGGGRHDVFLAPFKRDDPTEVEKWKRQLKTNLTRLGFDGLPGQLGAAIHSQAFTGNLVELTVKHEPRSDGKVDAEGNPYMNQKVFIERFVGVKPDPSEPLPDTSPAGRHAAEQAKADHAAGAAAAGRVEQAAADAFQPAGAGFGSVADDDIPF